MKIPHGWKLVPIEPTKEMLKAACAAALSAEVLLDDTPFSCDRAGYAAAIAAAPQPPTESPQQAPSCGRRGGSCSCTSKEECIHG